MDETKNDQTPKINNDKELKVLRTYASDIAELVRENDGSIVKIAVAEQEKEQEKNFFTEEKIKDKKRNLFWIIGGIIIFILAIYGSYYFYQKIKQSKTVIPEKEKMETFLSYDQNTKINTDNIFSNIEITEKIKKELAKTENPKSIKAIFLNKKNDGVEVLLKADEILDLFKFSIPDEVRRSLSDKFLIGSYTKENSENNKQNLFLISETNNYNLAYKGMLSWEKTILQDMFVLFDINITGENANLLEKNFKDIVVNNKDARVLPDNENKEILYYIFANKNKLIITDDKEAINEIIIRLTTKNTKPL